MKLNRYVKIALPTLALALGLFVIITPTKAHALSAADWKPGRIIDDAVFFNKDAMNVQQIQDFLNSKVPVCDTNHNASFWMNGVWNAPPYTCLKNYSQNGKSSAQIIWEAGQAYGINPQAIIVILQKETGLVTDTWAAPWQYDRAMGYACPDTAACDTAYYGFSNQVNSAARQLRNYVTNPQYFNFKAGVTRNVRWHPNAACGSTPVYIETQATAALYNYTPYQPNGTALSNLYGGQNDGCSSYGNRNFWVYFSNWFGATNSAYYMCDANNNIVGSYNGNRLGSFKYNNVQTISLSISNNTSQGCAEIHSLNPSNYNSWLSHIMTTQPAFDGIDGRLIALDDGSQNSRLVFVKLAGTPNSNVEFHEWNKDYKTWKLHHESDLPLSDISNGLLLPLGNKIAFVKYKNTSYGKIEVHIFDEALTRWSQHTVTNQPVSEMDYGTIIPRGDKLVYVKYKNTPSSNIEFHEWAYGYQDWTYHTVTNQPVSEMDYGTIIPRGDKLVYVKYKNTPSSNIEFHEWAYGYQDWTYHSSSTLNVTSTPKDGLYIQ